MGNWVLGFVTYGKKKFNVCVLQVSNVQARAARLSWAPPAGLVNRHSNGMPVSCSFEVSLSDKGRDGKYRLIYR